MSIDAARGRTLGALSRIKLQRRALVLSAFHVWRSESIRGMSAVFALKAAIVLSSFALLTLAARALGEVDFGTYSILFSAVGLICVVATFGQQVFIMRAWNEYATANDPSRLKGALIFSISACVLGSTIVGAVFALVLAKDQAPPLALAATLYLLTFGLSQTSSHLVRTAVGVAAGDGYGNLLVTTPAIIYLAACLTGHHTADVGTVLFWFSVGGTAVLGIHAVMIWRRLRVMFPGLSAVTPTYNVKSWNARSLKLWMSACLEASNQYVDVLIIGYLMSPAVAGAYFVTTRLANGFATASDAMNMFSTRHIPHHYYRKDFNALGELLDSVSRMALIIIGGGLIVILGGGYWLLEAFNPAYTSYYSALAVLSAGTAAVAAVSPCASFLMLTGHEGRYLEIMGSSVSLRAVLFFVLIPHFGIIGAVTATTLSFLFMAAALGRTTKKLTGIDASILRLISFRGVRHPSTV